MSLTEVFAVGVDAALRLIVAEDVVHLNTGEQHVGSGQLVLGKLDHGDLLVDHGSLAETHVRLHPGEVLELTLGKALLEPLLESSGKHI